MYLVLKKGHVMGVCVTECYKTGLVYEINIPFSGALYYKVEFF